MEIHDAWMEPSLAGMQFLMPWKNQGEWHCGWPPPAQCQGSRTMSSSSWKPDGKSVLVRSIEVVQQWISTSRQVVVAHFSLPPPKELHNHLPGHVTLRGAACSTGASLLPQLPQSALFSLCRSSSKFNLPFTSWQCLCHICVCTWVAAAQSLLLSQLLQWVACPSLAPVAGRLPIQRSQAIMPVPLLETHSLWPDSASQQQECLWAKPLTALGAQGEMHCSAALDSWNKLACATMMSKEWLAHQIWLFHSGCKLGKICARITSSQPLSSCLMWQHRCWWLMISPSSASSLGQWTPHKQQLQFHDLSALLVLWSSVSLFWLCLVAIPVSLRLLEWGAWAKLVPSCCVVLLARGPRCHTRQWAVSKHTGQSTLIFSAAAASAPIATSVCNFFYTVFIWSGILWIFRTFQRSSVFTNLHALTKSRNSTWESSPCSPVVCNVTFNANEASGQPFPKREQLCSSIPNSERCFVTLKTIMEDMVFTSASPSVIPLQLLGSDEMGKGKRIENHNNYLNLL